MITIGIVLLVLLPFMQLMKVKVKPMARRGYGAKGLGSAILYMLLSLTALLGSILSPTLLIIGLAKMYIGDEAMVKAVVIVTLALFHLLLAILGLVAEQGRANQTIKLDSRSVKLILQAQVSYAPDYGKVIVLTLISFLLSVAIVSSC